MSDEWKPIATAPRESNQYSCDLCQERGKTWEGSDTKCAFGHGLSFSRENWRCATMAVFRDACRESAVWNGDQSVGVVAIPESCCDETREFHPAHLVLSWYKSRGRTDGAIVLDSDGCVYPLTARLAEAIANALGTIKSEKVPA